MLLDMNITREILHTRCHSTYAEVGWHLAHLIRDTLANLNSQTHWRPRRGRQAAVVRVKDRASGRVAARVAEQVDDPTLQTFVTDHDAAAAEVHEGLPHRSTVRQSV